MASLTGQTISSTYDSLLKLIDNEPITSAFKEITDGVGNSSKLYFKNNGSFGFGAEPYDIGGDVNVGVTGSSWPTLSVVNSTTKDFISLESVSSISMINAGNTDGINYNALSFVVGGSERVKINTNGQLSLLNYTSDTSFTGTVAGYLAFTSAGNIITTAGLSGTGTTNTVPKFTSASAIGNSNITDNGSLITLGSNSYVNGKLGVGINVSADTGFYVSQNITGATSAWAARIVATAQSDVSSAAIGIGTQIGTASGAVGHIQHFRATQLTFNSTPANQSAFIVPAGLTGATNNFAFRGQLASATNAWNLYMDGTANNHLAGSLGIGATSLNGYNLRISKSLTGTTSVRSLYQESIIQSDVTTLAAYNTTYVGTAAASFTLPNLYHNDAIQGVFGAGSTVSNQIGYRVDSSLIGATNNFGFYGNIPSGANRWNLYMNGTANNYIAGSLGIGTTSLTGFNVGIGKSITGATTAFGIYQTSDILADVTSAAWAFATNLGTAASTISGEIVHYRAASKTFGAGSTITNQFAFAANSSISGATNNYAFYSSIASGTGRWGVYMAGTATNYLAGVLTIGTTSPSASALLQMNSTTQGFLPPRMTQAQRTAIASPAVGLIVYQTDSVEGAYVYKSSGWVLMA